MKSGNVGRCIFIISFIGGMSRKKSGTVLKIQRAFCFFKSQAFYSVIIHHCSVFIAVAEKFLNCTNLIICL